MMFASKALGVIAPTLKTTALKELIDICNRPMIFGISVLSYKCFNKKTLCLAQLLIDFFQRQLRFWVTVNLLIVKHWQCIQFVCFMPYWHG